MLSYELPQVIVIYDNLTVFQLELSLLYCVRAVRENFFSHCCSAYSIYSKMCTVCFASVYPWYTFCLLPIFALQLGLLHFQTWNEPLEVSLWSEVNQNHLFRQIKAHVFGSHGLKCFQVSPNKPNNMRKWTRVCLKRHLIHRRNWIFQNEGICKFCFLNFLTQQKLQSSSLSYIIFHRKW